MFVLIWGTLLLSVRGSSADTGASMWEQKHCQNGHKDFCITLSEQNLTAEAGLCVVIPCSFKTASSFTTQHIVWLKCAASEEQCDVKNPIFHSNRSMNVKSGFEGRVSLLELDVNQENCSIIINDLKESDSGSYQLRVTGNSTTKKEDGFTFLSKTNVSVEGRKQKPSVMIPTLTEGQQATLTCTAPALCSGSVPDITWTWRGAGGTESHITGNITAFKTENLTAVTQRHVSSLTFNPSMEHHNTNITCNISFTGGTIVEETSTLIVNYKRKPQIIGNTTVKEENVLNLTCSVESFPPALIVWKKLSFNASLQKGIYNDLQTDTGSASLVIHNVTTEHSGEYICTARHLNTTVTSYVNVTVTWFSKIQSGSGCVLQSEVLTCVCISEGFPLPTITWPLLKDHTEYSVITTVSNHTVNSTVRLPVKKHGNTTVECVSNNGNGEAKLTLLIQKSSKKDGQSLFLRLGYLIIAFLTGVLLSSVICCLAKSRKKQKSCRNLDRMETHQVDLMVCDSQALQGDQTLHSNNFPKEVVYANIDLSLLRRNGAREAATKQESTKTEYAEIKNAVKEERRDDGGEKGEMLEGKEEEVMMEVEMKLCEPGKEELKEEAVYSTVKDLIDEI